MKIRPTIAKPDREYGVCHGTMQYGSTVHFWCESLDGDVTDTVIVAVEFPLESMASSIALAASWKRDWLPPRHASGSAVSFDDVVIEFRDSDTAASVLAAAFTTMHRPSVSS